MRLKEEGAAQVKASTDRLGQSFDQTTAKAKAYDLTLGSLKGAFSGLVSGFAASAVFQKIITETVDAEYATAQLNAALISTKGIAGQSADALNKHAEALSYVSAFDDDAITGAQALLLTFTKIQGDVFPKATAAILDMAAAMNTDLKSATLQVGKALNDPILGVSALARAGVQFSEAQKDVIKSLTETGRLAEAQGIILAELTTQFEGSAAAAANTLGGALKQLTNELGNLLTLSQANSKVTVNFINLLKDSLIGLRVVLGELSASMPKASSGFALLGQSAQQAFFPIAALFALLSKKGKQAQAEAKAAAVAVIASVAPQTMLADAVKAVGKQQSAARQATQAIIPKLRTAIGATTSTQTQPSVVPPQVTAVDPTTMAKVRAQMDAVAVETERMAAETTQRLQQSFAGGVVATFADALAAGFETAIATGKISEGFKAFGSVLLSGLGGMLQQFGTAALLANKLMIKLMTSMATMNPVTGIAASLALIALGGVLKGAARSAFGGGAGGGGGNVGGYSAPAMGGNMTMPTAYYGPTSAGSANTIERVNPISVTIIGPNDPTAQRQMQELLRNAQRRGNV
jgi:hypothetical protein